MRLRSIAPVSLALLMPLVGACEMNYEAPPPATPQNAQDVPPPAPPDPSAAAPSSDDAMYASGEYAIGEDTDAYDDNDPSALTDFHGALDAHGTWTDDPNYGTVWAPNGAEVGEGFTPYSTAGHWAYDDDEYVWVSDYDWGWAPFHYGRWVYIDGRGWAWVPGRVYRGAWVDWGWDDGYGYVGWYPMAPAFFWFGGYAMAYSFYVGPRWVYCGRGDVFSPVVGTRVIAGAAVGPVAARVHGYVGAAPGVGPAPARLGYSPQQIPHAAGTPALAHAQQFGRPSTATALGARPAYRPPTAGGGSAPYAGARAPYAGSHGPITAAPGSPSRRKVEPESSPQVRRGTPTTRGGSTYHPPPSTGGTFHPSGGGGGRGGGGGGGHGGHR
jgi:hypothetical protein